MDGHTQTPTKTHAPNSTDNQASTSEGGQAPTKTRHLKIPTAKQPRLKQRQADLQAGRQAACHPTRMIEYAPAQTLSPTRAPPGTRAACPPGMRAACTP
eukprot:356913-Chlamydomonas_euryale.AAC.2